MKYNSDIHHRRSIRMKGYDYSQEGLYFVTICVQNRDCLFGEITDCKMVLNEFGQAAEQYWLEITQHYPDTVLHEYVIMPNHIHGIIEIIANDDGRTNVGAKNFSPLHGLQTSANFSPPHGAQTSMFKGTSRTVGAIVRGFKIGVTKNLGFSIWQRNYYEQIVRSNDDYISIADYINNNTANWEQDDFYINNQSLHNKKYE